jgi:16S rRNA (guanine966-N2)-methyltransferase
MRIIAGKFRGRRIVAPTGMATRPTSDRVREAWFSMLGPLNGLVVDLYAGTGALGFEALSRGADRVIFVESAKPALKSIESNAKTLGVMDQITLMSSTVETAIRSLKRLGPFDLILTDPPWTHMQSAELTLRRLLSSDLLTEDGRIVLGHPRGKPVELSGSAGLQIDKARNWGDSAATFFSRAEKPAEL